jgi:hypothetical protein
LIFSEWVNQALALLFEEAFEIKAQVCTEIAIPPPFDGIFQRKAFFYFYKSFRRETPTCERQNQDGKSFQKVVGEKFVVAMKGWIRWQL